MLFETEIIINGFYFEKVDGIRALKSVFILDTDNNTCIEVPVLNDENINREKLAKELQENYRKKVMAIIDIKNDIKRPNSNYVDLGFVGIKNYF
mgnify:CR=1 FL=1